MKINLQQNGQYLARPPLAVLHAPGGMRHKEPILVAQGISLVELMIAITLGLFVVLVITGLVIASKSAQSTQLDVAEIHDTARFALDNIRRSVRQAGFVPLDQDDAPLIDTENMTASVIGFDAGSLQATKDGIDFPVISKNSSANSSDILALRFFGSGIPADDTILSCAGFGVPGPTHQSTAENERGWSIYYVANDVGNEPALFCKFKNKNKSTFSAQAIARGVESFQVLYGISTLSPTNEGVTSSGTNTTQFLSAKQITALDSGIPASDLNKKTHWKKVTAIKVALLIRGAINSRLDTSTTTYNLFGEDYGNRMGGTDKGTQINEANMPVSQRNRLRKVSSATIQIRNPMY